MTGEPTSTGGRGLDLGRLYRYRFEGVDPAAKQSAWEEIARFLWERTGRPARVLDIAAGAGEFIRAVPATERWALDLVDSGITMLPGVHAVIAPIDEVDLPEGGFDLVFVSNFLEHLSTPDAVADVLARVRGWLAPGGKVAVLGPNFRYCAGEYFDCADHTLALTDVAVAEHLYAAGFEVVEAVPRFLPYSFRSRLPAAPGLVARYLRFPPAWRLLGKQFLVVGARR